MEKLDGMSLNVEQAELDKLRAVFPQCFAEGKLDLSKLLSLLGEYDDNDFEKYKFEWKGKSESLRLAQQRSMGTLRPAPEDSVDWDTTQNVYIEGDNLEVLKLLQTDYYRRVKMIYIDPPYNTGNDFVYEDDFKDPIQKYKEITGQTTKSNPESMGRFHTAWLNMMYPRLRLASNLLADDGVIFISIDDNELYSLKRVCDEVFGEEHFLGTMSWLKKRKGSFLSKKMISLTEYVLVYSKSQGVMLFGGEPDQSESQPLIKRTNSVKVLKFPGNYISTKLPEGRYESGVYGEGSSSVNLLNDIVVRGGLIETPFSLKGPFIWSQENLDAQIGLGAKLVINTSNFQVRAFKIYEDDAFKGLSSFIDGVSIGGTNEDGYEELKEIFGAEKILDYPKPVKLIKMLVDSATHFDKDSIIIDFFSGSGTTAHAVMQLNAEDGGNRRFVMVQLPEVTDEQSEANKAGFKNICEIGKERIRRAGDKIKNEWKTGQAKRNDGLFAVENEPQSPPDIGFKVFKLDTSNLKTWDSTPVDKNDTQQMDLLLDRMNEMIDTIKNDRSDLDIVYEVILKMGGVDLTDPVKAVEIDDKRAYTIGENDEMLLCLHEGLTAEIIEKMADEFIPSKMILSEKCFTDDTAMANAHYILKEREIELKLV